MITIAFMADDPAEAAKILEFINDAGIEVGARRPTSSSASAARTGGGAAGSASVSADDGWGNEPQNDSADDPWSDNGSHTENSGGRQGGSQGRSGGNEGPWADVPRSGEKWIDTKNGKRRYEFGLDDAPDCHCGHPAVRFSGKNAQGKIWSKWLCALGSTKSYKDKCQFEEWASRK